MSGTVELRGDYLTAPAFTLQVCRSAMPSNGLPLAGDPDPIQDRMDGEPSIGTSFIYQARPPNPPQRQPNIVLSNFGGSRLFRAFLNGVGAAVPSPISGPLSDEQEDENEQEYFFPIRGPLPSHASTAASPQRAVLASSLQGLWAGCYAAHGYEFGTIVLRNVWTRLHTADEVALEQIYDDEGEEELEYSAEPSVVREPLATDLEGSIKRRRSILEFIKVTGDTNVPAGQVSWVAILPSQHEGEDVRFSAMQRYMDNSQPEPDLQKLMLQSVLRRDWEEWSDMPPSMARQNNGNGAPRWNEGSVQAAGRIAFDGFVDTRFIDAQATFVRELSGEVDEIRIRWYVIDPSHCLENRS